MKVGRRGQIWEILERKLTKSCNILDALRSKYRLVLRMTPDSFSWKIGKIEGSMTEIWNTQRKVGLRWKWSMPFQIYIWSSFRCIWNSIEYSSSTLATSCEELTHWKRLWCWEGLGAGGEVDDRCWDGWMASLARCTWVWGSTSGFPVHHQLPELA